MNANGTNPHSLATGWAPSWSPNGSQILFTVTGAALDPMNADGSNVRPLNPHESMISASIQTTTWTSAAITTPNPDPSALRPDLEGEPLVGSWLQLENTGWVGAVDNNLEATWYRCQPSNLCATTLPSTTTSYRLTANDLGFYIGARVDPAVHGPSYRAILSDPTIPICLPFRPPRTCPPSRARRSRAQPSCSSRPQRGPARRRSTTSGNAAAPAAGRAKRSTPRQARHMD